MAVADEDFRDSDGAPSDWIELTNTGGQPVSLGGFYLTNNRNDLTRWALPGVEVAPGGSLIVFASGKDRTDLGELHARFTLDRGGDYLALVEPDGVTVASEISPAYPAQFPGISYGLGISGSEGTELLVPFGSPLKFHIPLDASLGRYVDWAVV